MKSGMAGKATEKATDTSGESELTALLDMLPTGVFGLDPAGRVVYSNRWLEQFLGVQRGQSFSSAFPARQRARIDSWQRRLFTGAESDSSALLLPLANGQFSAELMLEAACGAVDGKRVAVGLVLLQTNPRFRHTLTQLLDPLRRTLLVVETLLSQDEAPTAHHPLGRGSVEPDPYLSPREREVLARCLDGVSVHAISAQLEISVFTVRNHLKSIYKKLDVRSRAELVKRYASLSQPT